jgi:hypothetical protein
MLKTKKQIIDALNKLAPDQADVIHQMADNRVMDADSLTNYQYYLLIKEEAEVTVHCAIDEDKAEAQEYAEKLLAIANNIDTEN